jgi:hypothetical protein
VEDELISWPLLNSLPNKPEKKPYHNLLKIDLVWRNLSKGALYDGRTECLVVILRRGRHLCTLFSSPWGRVRSDALRHGPALLKRSGALACDFGQQNDNRQADQPD